MTSLRLLKNASHYVRNDKSDLFRDSLGDAFPFIGGGRGRCYPAPMSPPFPAPRALLAAALALAAVVAGPADAASVADPLLERLAQAAPALDRKVLALATRAVTCTRRQPGAEPPPSTLSVIDFSRPSTEPRLWVFDLASHTLLFEELVAHGRNTGENLATRFSNRSGSNMSSLGVFRTAESYVGAEIARAQGRLGRSLGCPAVRPAIARQLIDRIRGGSVVFAYYPDSDWLQRSRLLDGDCGATRHAGTQAPATGGS